MDDTLIANTEKGVNGDMYKGKDPRRNASGYIDMTTYQALNAIEAEEKAEIRLKKLLNTIFYIVDLAGFHIEERLVIKDKKTGKVWR